MTLYWLLYPVTAALLWACVNHLDKYLLDKYCKNREIGGLIIFSSLIGFPVSIIISLFDNTVLNIDFIPALIIVLAGCLYIIGIIPYLYALDMDETTVVAPQALMLTAFAGLLGYFFLGEEITTPQLLGIIIILFGAFTLSLEVTELFRLKLKVKIFLLMMVSSFFIALQLFLFKYFALDISFWKTVFWLHIGFVVISVFFLLFIGKYRNEFFTLIKTNPLRIITVNIAGEITTIAGNLLSYYGTLLAPLAIVETMSEGIQPFFVVIIGVIITMLTPGFSVRNLRYSGISHKILSILIMVVGLYLLI